MRTIFKAALLAGAAWSAASCAFAQDNTPAPSGAQADATAVQEIVVTARRREETLKDVPISMTAVTGEALEKRGAQDITDLQKTTPNLTLQVARGSNSTLIAFIRGVGQQDPLWGFEPGVGLYVDDVYIARPQAAVLDIFDVQRVEVLRGPQGTLYGRNTIGGAIKYVTARIGSTPQLKVKGVVGNYSEKDLIVSGKTPIGDMLGISGAFATYNHDGYGKNLNTGAEHYNRDAKAGRLSLEFTPTESLFFRLSADRTVDDSNPRHGHREQPLIVGGAVVPGTEPPSSVYDTRAGIGDKNKVVAQGVSLTGEWKASDFVTLKSISAYRDGHTSTVIDFDNLPQPILDIPGFYADHQFSQEFQALFNGGNWNGVAGVYYLNAMAEGAFDTVIGNLNLTTLTHGKVNTRSWAAFGDFSYNFTDQLSASVGGRWTHDEKTADQFRQNYLGIRSPFFGNNTAIALGSPRTNYADNKRTFEQFTPRVSVSYKFTPEITGYASYGRGFKSGGFDMRGDAVSYPATVKGYNPEKVGTYEVGLKGSVLDNRVNFATALFRSDYKDQQITSQFLIPPATVVSFVDNAGSSRIQGWEFEGSLRATDWLTFNTQLGYTDAKFKEFVTYDPTCTIPAGGTAADCRRNLADQRHFQNTPKWTNSFGLAAHFDTPDGGDITFTPTAAYRSAYQMFETAFPALDQPAYWLYDASLVYTSPGEKYRVGLHGKNLSDEHYRVGGYNFPGPLTGNSVIGFYGPPRTVLLSLEATF